MGSLGLFGSICLLGSLWVSVGLLGTPSLMTQWSLSVSLCIFSLQEDVCVSFGNLGSLSLLGVFGSLWVSLCLFWSLSVSFGLFGSLWVSLGFLGLLESLWISLGLFGFP